MGNEERTGYIEHLESFVEEHRDRLEEMLRTHGPGSRPASHGRYALIGQPETLIIVDRMESNPFSLRGQWEKKLETVFLDDLESRGAAHPTQPVSRRERAVGPGQSDLVRPHLLSGQPKPSGFWESLSS
ncbi:hypothetical protein [Streptomyces sp. NPDC048445]|uniref:hypothetical protein n=1 Tax=unclassified Streptomyces TaxID=2593676 RepID=UPI003722E5A4